MTMREPSLRAGERGGRDAQVRELLLIGIGAGDPDWLTLEAVRAIQRLDVLFVVLKEQEKDDLVDARRAVIAAHRDRPLRTVELRDPARPWRTAPDYAAAVARWREERRGQWTEAVGWHLGAGEVGGFLVWGDPGLYESTLAIVDELVEADRARAGRCRGPPVAVAVVPAGPLTRRVIPGISSVHALTARHGIPLNRQGRAVQISPARTPRGRHAGGDRRRGRDARRRADLRLDRSRRPRHLLGAYLGTPDELLLSGDLAAVRDDTSRRAPRPPPARDGCSIPTSCGGAEPRPSAPRAAVATSGRLRPPAGGRRSPAVGVRGRLRAWRR